MKVRSRTSTSVKRPSTINRLTKPVPKRTTATKIPGKDAGHLYAGLFHMPRTKKDIDVDRRVWKKIIASLPIGYQMPDAEALKKLHAASRQQEGGT
ncbi:hypothetical protein SAMN05428962_3433 [Paenibacillus sp. BC26]|nr:hypothetical protein SAMN05428962_3433 [Paenibacillus sp. BC26]